MSGKVLPIGSTAPWHGGRVGETATCVLAPNPSPWTLDGTNTWILAAPGAHEALIVDPGPDDAAHLNAIEASLADRDLRATAILLTHGHPDHAQGAEALAQRLRVPVQALDPAFGTQSLAEGEVVRAGGLEVRVVATPGHTSDSLCFLVEHDGAILTGDTILGRGTTVVAWPDGRLSDYLDSLRRLREVAGTTGASRVLPGHGPVLDDPVAVVDAYLAHRAARLDQVREIVDSGVVEVDEIVAIAYADVPREVWGAASLSVRAQVEYLLEISGPGAPGAQHPR
jgi:glyoxylase-like metal-dependent hydrolase (beta-lactamase superfamily II)